MADTMTLPLDEGKNALSLRDGVQALQTQRAKSNPETETSKEETPQEEQTVSDVLEDVAEEEQQEPAIEEASEEEAQEEASETEEEDFEETSEVEEEPDGTLLTLKDGTKLTADEIESSYMRQADYTRKTQKLADDRKTAQSLFQDKMIELDTAVSLVAPEPEPDWEKVASQDPQNWTRRKLAFDNKKAKQQQAVQTLEKMRNDIIVENKQKAVNDLQSGVYRPDWKNEKTFLKDMEATSNFAMNKLGFSEQELYRVGDSRAIMALDLARRFAEKSQNIKTANKKVVNKPNVIKGGAKVAQKQSKANSINASKKQFMKTGSREDALAYMKRTRNSAKT